MNAGRGLARRARVLLVVDVAVVFGVVAGMSLCAVAVASSAPGEQRVTFAESTTTTWVMGDLTVTARSMVAPAAGAVAAEHDPGGRAPLTGLVISPDEAIALSTRRAIAVKIDDAPQVDRHDGLERADLVYEVIVEGGLTRYVGVFHSRTTGRVGPVRSVRTTDFDLTANLSTPVLAFSGGNAGTVAAARASDLLPFPPASADGGAVFRRDASLKSPHNLFLDLDGVWGRVLGGRAPVSPFAHRDPFGGEAPAAVAPAGGLHVAFSASTDAVFRLDAATGKWARWQRGVPQVDGEGHPLLFDNVVVLSTLYGTSPFDAHSPQAWSIGGGDATVLTGGGAVACHWSRPTGTDPFTLTAGDGSPVLLDPGTTWAALAWPGTTTLLAP